MNSRAAAESRTYDFLVLGELDCGNLGNDGTFESFLDEVRTERPETSLHVFGYGTHNLADRLGVTEEPMNALVRRGTPTVRKAKKVLLRVGDFPRTASRVRRGRAVVVAGTGLFEGDHGTQFQGWPLAFWRTAAACRLWGRPLAVVSVGASPVRERVSRALFAAGLRWATDVSYRDTRSLQVARAWLKDPSHGRLSADLAFATSYVTSGLSISPSRPFVALGVMSKGGGTIGTDSAKHVTSMETVVRGLVARAYDVRLIIGDELDRPILEQLKDRLQDLAGVSAVTPSTLKDLAGHVSEASAVIATRFHNIVVALACRRVTVAISYADKTRDLMERVDLGGSVLNAAEVDGDRLLCLFDRAVDQALAPSEASIAALRSLARRDIARTLKAFD